jgi:hypothetical protein
MDRCSMSPGRSFARAQGTLYGNTTGGAINYSMNKPTKDLSAGASATWQP